VQARRVQDGAELLGEFRVAVDDEEPLPAQEPVDVFGQVARDLRHELRVRVRCDASDLDGTRGKVDGEEDVVRHEPARRPDLDGEEVGGSDHSSMGLEEGAP
jgi:hypothetical protein